MEVSLTDFRKVLSDAVFSAAAGGVERRGRRGLWAAGGFRREK